MSLKIMESSEYNTSNKYQKEEAFLRAEKRLKALKGFYSHAFFYVVVNLFLIVMIAINAKGDFWNMGTFSTPLFWGIGLFFHAIGVFGKNRLFSKAWEERKIQEYMESDQTKWE